MKKALTIILSVLLVLVALPMSVVAETEPLYEPPIEQLDNYFGIMYWDYPEGNPGSSTAWVKVNSSSEIYAPNSYTTFATGTEITFSLHNFTNDVPRILIQMFTGSPEENPVIDEVWGNWEETHNQISVQSEGENNYSFSFTPTKQNHFIVSIVWNDLDELNHFDCNSETEKQFTYWIQGNGSAVINAGYSSLSREIDGTTRTKVNIPSSDFAGDKIPLTITPNPGSHLKEIEIWGDTNRTVTDTELSIDDQTGAITYNVNLSEIEFIHNIVFEEDGQGGGQDEPGPGPQPQLTAKEAVEADRYAYSEGTAPKLDFKTKLAVEIFYENFAGDRPYSGIFASYTDVKDKIDMGVVTSTDSEIEGLSYYPCTLTIIPAKDAVGTEGQDGYKPAEDAVVAEFKAYILSSDTNFVVYGEKADGTKTYKVLDAAGATFDEEVSCAIGFKQDSNDDQRDYVDVFGNGVCQIGGIQTSSLDIKAYHITQEHSHFCDNEFINNTRDDFSDDLITQLSFKLVVYQEGMDVIKIKAPNSAAAWDFADFSGGLSGTEENHGFAQIFFGNNLFKIPKYSLSGATITNVELVGPERAATITTDTDGNFDVRINSNYFNYMTYKITYDNGSVGYIDVELVGIQLTRHDIPNGECIYQFHGTDHCTSYTNIGESNIDYIATFYYDNDSELNDDGSAKKELNSADRVDLIVTITKKDGKKIVNTIPNANAITHNGNVCYDDLGRQKAGLASQGNRHYYDDFLVWSGTEAEWEKLAQIEVNAVKHSDDTTFGGSMLGSGAGVGVQM